VSDVIEQLKEIVKEHQYRKIDGVIVDVMTASAILKVYENINETNREKYLKLPITRMADIAWQLLNK
jgi:hypothetical protein